MIFVYLSVNDEISDHLYARGIFLAHSETNAVSTDLPPGARVKAQLFPAPGPLPAGDFTASPTSDSPVVVPPPRNSKSRVKNSASSGRDLPASAPAKQSDKLLDSVFLQWRLHHRKLTSLPAKRLLDVFQKEVVRFQKYSPRRCRKLAAQVQSAFELILADPVELASLKSIEDPTSLRDRWVEAIFAAIRQIRRKINAASTFGKNSVVAGFLGSIPSPSPPAIPKRHPPGAELRVSKKRARKAVSFDESSTSEEGDPGEYSVSSTDDETDPPPRKSSKKSSAPPLAFDDAAKEHVKALRSAKTMREWKSKTVDWIADTFGNGSSHIKQVISGRYRDLDWSRKQLARAGERVIALFDKVALRESLGDEVSRENKKAMLKSESLDLANIRISLHVIRLGADGARRYYQKVEDESARNDFELISGSARSYKIFSKELASSQKAKPSSSSSSRRSRPTPRRRRAPRGRPVRRSGERRSRSRSRRKPPPVR